MKYKKIRIWLPWTLLAFTLAMPMAMATYNPILELFSLSGANITISKNLEVDGHVSVSGMPMDGNHVANREYVDQQAAAASDWQKNQSCPSGKVFSGYDASGNIVCEDVSNSSSDLFGKTCPEDSVFSGYNGDGSIKCTSLAENMNQIGSSIQIDGAISDGSGNYFSVGGGNFFCLKYSVNHLGEATYTEVNDGSSCNYGGSYTCWDAKCLEVDNGGDDYCRDYDLLSGAYVPAHYLESCASGKKCNAVGECRGGEGCTVEGGSGVLGKISYDGAMGNPDVWIACTNLDCDYQNTGKVAAHVINDGSSPDDVCRDPLYATSVDTATGDVSGHAWSASFGYIAMGDGDAGDGVDYGISLPANLASGDVVGTAWSSSVGYIRFSDENLEDGIGYGVSYDSGTDQISGYAWSPAIGYIRMDGTDVDGNGSVDYGVYLNRNTNRLEGTAWGPSAGYIRFTEEDSY